MPWELHYPASTLVAAIPFTLLPERLADLVFVFGSTFALAYGVTRENWNLVWIFPSAAWIIAVRVAQWSPLLASAYFLPLMTPFLFLKPTSGLAVMLTWTDRKVWQLTAATSVVLVSISLFVLPGWINDFFSTTIGAWEFTSPITRLGGFLLILSVLRWRQREARFLFVLALVPVVSSWYEALLPMLVARTKRECQALSLTSSLGYLLLIPLALSTPTHEIASSTIGRMMVAFCYLPALIVVLRRG